MGKPPSRPERHTRVYVSGLRVCGGLRMMGASGAEMLFKGFSVTAASKCSFVGGKLETAVSTPKSPSLSLLWTISTGAISSAAAFVPVSKGTVKGGVWLHLWDDVYSPHTEGTLNHLRTSFPNKPCCKASSRDPHAGLAVVPSWTFACWLSALFFLWHFTVAKRKPEMQCPRARFDYHLQEIK